MLGEEKQNHSTTKISSFTVYASIQVDGLNPGVMIIKFPGVKMIVTINLKSTTGNHLMHSYTSKGRKGGKIRNLYLVNLINKDSTIEIIGG